jgi:hypothetical protein
VRIIRRYWMEFQQFTPWLVAAVAVLSANWAADALSEYFNHLYRGERGDTSVLNIPYILFDGLPALPTKIGFF